MNKERQPLIKAAHFFIAFFAWLLVTNCLTAQTTDNMYKNNWKKIDSLIIKDRLPKDALKEVNKIYTLAKQEGNQSQLIKALLYKIQLTEATTDAAVPNAITTLEKEITTSTQPVKAILQSLLAESYWKYFQYNRWKLYDRTKVVKQKNEDINTWSAEDIHKKIASLYKAALSETTALQAISLQKYDAILHKGNASALRPTLYDILAFRALDYFSNQERTLTKPVESFKINTDAAYAPAAQFVNHQFTTEDTGSVYYQTLLLYQQLIRFHLKDIKPDALIDADLLRLNFVNSHSTATEKKQLYLNALQNIANQYGNLPAAAQAWYLIAEDHANKARSYSPKSDTSNRYGYIAALGILDKVLQQKDSSEGRINSFNLKTNILRKTLQLQTEKVNLPNEPFRSLIRYRNTDQIHLRIIKIDDAFIRTIGQMKTELEQWQRLISVAHIASTTYQLPATNDHQEHATELKLGALPLGQYAVLIASDKSFTPAVSLLAVQYINVSNIAYLQQEQQVFVVDRTSGKAISNASIETWNNVYNYETRKYQRTKLGTYYTNKNGLATIQGDPKKAQSMELVVKYGNDRLNLKESIYIRPNNPHTPVDTGNNRTYLFTDRSIYRPGQTVYFKGIIVKEKSNAKQVEKGITTTVLLYDANYSIIDSIKVTTNEFGSYAAQFKLPENALNGSFQIRDDNQSGYTQINVEEYKRPTFSANLKTPEGMIRLGNQVTINGEAIAFAGNNIIDATVNYRVVRKQYWSPYFRYWPPYPAREDQEIANGSIKTDANGQFKIDFKAIAADADKSQKQISYYFEISADVTDIAGETRSASTSIHIGNKAVHLSFGLPASLPADSLNKLIVHANNSGGIAQSIPVDINIFSLKAPNRTFRARFWDAPDVFILSKEEYEKSFPLDIYDNENLPENWEIIPKPVYSVTDSTTVTGDWNTNWQQLSPGWYKIEASGIDAFGEKVTAFHYLQLTGKTETDKMFAIRLDNNNYSARVGEPLQIQWQSNFQPGLVIKDIYRTDKKNPTEYITNSAKGTITLQPEESDRGGMGLVLTSVKHNRFYQVNTTITIPWTNKALEITTETFRDKLQPGANETWTINVHPKEGQPQTAELLAAMYDASLDQFKPHRWNQPYWMQFNAIKFWNPAQNFTQQYSRSSESINPDSSLSLDKQYDVLLTPYNLFGTEVYYGQMPGAPIHRANAEMNMRSQAKQMVTQDAMSSNANLEESVTTESADNASGIIEIPKESVTPIVRSNFNETAFFFPQLKTDNNGKLSFSFTMPESLTKWKWMSFAHTPDMQSGYLEHTILTQKDLMVQPNLPRFLREGDKINLSTRIANLTDKAITGQVVLELLDAFTRKPLDGIFQNITPQQHFNANAGGSTVAHFSVQVPFQYSSPIIVRIIGSAGTVSDGEETILPILPSTQMVIETYPIFLNGAGKTINWEKFAQSFQSETLQQHGLTVEFTSNPIWYAVQALPTLKQIKNPSITDQFSRFYAHVMSAGIINSKPRIKAILQQWMLGDTSTLISQLHKNEDLKAILLEETPWVLEATTEKEQRRRLALLLDMATLQKDLASSWKAVIDLQTANGGFPWFPGGQDNRFMTQYLLTGIGQLKKAGLLQQFEDNGTNKGLETAAVIEQALNYLDARLLEDYQLLLTKKQDLVNYQPDNTIVLQLYLRSFFPDNNIAEKYRLSYQYFRQQAYKYWNKQNLYQQGMIALVMLRNKETSRAGTIFKSIQQQAINENNENGMYWKKNIQGYHWYQSSIDVQALLIEAFAENFAATKQYGKEINAMKTWLIKQKQTTAWSNTISTAKACYALLLQGEDNTNHVTTVQVELGKQQLVPDTEEAGTGYFKVKIPADKVTPDMANIAVKVATTTVENKNTIQPVWGSIYWQYTEQMDKITSADANKELAIQKEYFLQKNSINSPTLISISEETALKIGDKVVVRIIITSNRDMDYVHLKEVRGAGFEPIDVLSGYQWKNGLAFYQSTKDASTQFFFDKLPKGTHVLEYGLFATHSGKFGTGTGNLQCLYAPEFSAHTKGFSIRIEE